jgi:hypothetical protein
MSASPSPAPPVSARPSGTILLPATRFFVRRIPLVAGQDAVAQVELALENFGPFTPGQLYYGYCPSRDGTQALVFAAYRKNFSAADTAGWAVAHAVLPEFAVWLGQAAAVPAGLWVHERPDSLTVLVWEKAEELPAGLLARETTAETREKVRQELIEEARRRFGGGAGAPKILTAATVAGVPGKEGLPLSAGERSALLSPAQLRAMDVRDKVELAGQITRQKRDRLLWLAFASAVAGLAACIVVELGLQVSSLLLARQRRGLEANVAAVRQIEQANQLAVRMENLAGQSLRPFEMLAVLNSARPAPVPPATTSSLEFVRVQTAGPRQMEIEAQSANAADPQDYEKALARTANVEKVELRDFRISGGKTTFLVAVTFKPGFAGPGGAR